MPYRSRAKQKEYQAIWYKKNKEEIIKRQRDRRNRTRKSLQDYKEELCCEVCGYNRCTSALDFHHNDPDEKADTVANMAKYAGDWDTVLAEIKKCTVLCRNCHSELHAGIITLC